MQLKIIIKFTNNKKGLEALLASSPYIYLSVKNNVLIIFFFILDFFIFSINHFAILVV